MQVTKMKLNILAILMQLSSVHGQEASAPATIGPLSGPIWLTKEQMDDWNALKGDMDARVPAGFNDCNQEIGAAYTQAVQQYSSHALSDNVF